MKKIFFVLFILITSLYSCTKEGPVGPKGATGATGPQGAGGNANIYSGEYTVPSGAWTLGNTCSCYYVNIADADITLDVINNGAVLAYLVATDNNGNPYLETLPVTNSDGTSLTCFAQLGNEQLQAYGFTSKPADDTIKIVTMSPEMLHIHPELRKPNLPYDVVKPYIQSTRAVLVSKSK